MKKRLTGSFVLAVVFTLSLLTGFAGAAVVMPDGKVSVTVPDEWEKANSRYASANAEVTRIFDCANEDPARIKAFGWKTGSDGKVAAAFCVTYYSSGMGKMRTLLGASQGKEREALAAKFLDTFAGKVKLEYQGKRQMPVNGLSADLLEAGENFVVVMDGQVHDGARVLFRSSTAYMHGDALLSVNWVHDASAPQSLVQQLDAIALSVEWK